MKAIILAGGFGTRLKPWTDILPKPLVPIKGKPILSYVISNLVNNGIKDIILSVSYKYDKIIDFFKDGSNLNCNLDYNIEVKPLGTGGAVKSIVDKYKLGSQFVLVWGDNLSKINFKEMIDYHKNKKADLTIALTKVKDVSSFGVAKLDKNNRIISFVEKPKPEDAPSNYINAGAFVVNTNTLNILPKGASSFERDYIERITLKGNVFGFKYDGPWYPTDNMERYLKANKEWDL